MRAVILDLDIAFTVAPSRPEDGFPPTWSKDGEPPRSITISFRPCWRKPPQTFELAFAYEDGNVAYYHVVSRS